MSKHRKAFTLIGRKGLALRARKGFTLIEVLVAGSILFIVSAAVVGLSNSIIQGTSTTTDEASANRLATEGLELVKKIRDDTVKNAGFGAGEFIWFDPVENATNYGWYALEEDAILGDSWELNSVGSAYGNVINLSSAGFSPSAAEPIISGPLTFYRLICVEAVAAENDQSEDGLNCNTVAEGAKTVSDGNRLITSDCYSEADTPTVRREDIYCDFTQESLNVNRTVADKLIPDGNAIKIRSVVFWNDRDSYKSVQVATLLTNWRSVVE